MDGGMSIAPYCRWQSARRSLRRSLSTRQMRRVLEFVTLANAFCLLLSLAWLHLHFVHPKGHGASKSCLPLALERAGVDPAQLHILQVR